MENRAYVREVSECIMERIIELSHEGARRVEAARTFAAPPVLWRLAAALALPDGCLRQRGFLVASARE